MLRVYHGPMLVLVPSLSGQNTDLKLPGHSRLVLAQDCGYITAWYDCGFYFIFCMYVFFQSHRANGMVNSVIKDVKGEGIAKNDYKTPLFLYSQMWPLAFELYYCSCPQHICQNSGSFYFHQRIIKVSMIFSHICFFLTSITSPALYCDLRRLPNSMSSSPSHQYDKSSWFFKKGLWNLWSDSCNWKCPSYTWMIFWLGTQIYGLTFFPWGFMCVAYLLKDILRTVWLFSSLNCHGFSALIFEIISLYVKSSRSIILLLGLVGKQ